MYKARLSSLLRKKWQLLVYSRRARVHAHGLRHSPVGQLRPGWFGNHLCRHLPERHLGASGKCTQRGSAVWFWFQGQKHTLAGRKSDPCRVGGLRPLLPKPGFAEPKGRAELLGGHNTDVPGRRVCFACAQQDSSMPKVCVKISLLHGESQGPGALALQTRWGVEGREVPSPPHPPASSIAQEPGVWAHQKLQRCLQPAQGRNPREPLWEGDCSERSTEKTALI